MHFLEKHWLRFTWVSALLSPLSALFAAIAAARRLAYRSGALRPQRLAVPVVVVGNLSAGGTGKTPTVLWLAQALRERGFAPGIVSRGYGGSARLTEVAADSDPAQVGDEPALLASRGVCPVVVGRDRAAAARLLLAAHPAVNIVLSDDGLQHYRLARDAEIAVVDSRRGFGNGWLLPAGPLRERRSRLATVDAIVSNGAMAPLYAAPQFVLTLEGTLCRNLRDATLCREIGAFAGESLHAVAGIGDPERFFEALRRQGLDIHAHAFPDHHPFTGGDLAFGDDLPVIMTEKDAIKCRSFARANWWMLPVSARIDAGLADLITRKISLNRGRQAA